MGGARPGNVKKVLHILAPYVLYLLNLMMFRPLGLIRDQQPQSTRRPEGQNVIRVEK